MIRQTIFEVEKEREYKYEIIKKFITYSSFKKKFLWNIHENKDNTDNFDDNTLLKLFQNKPKIYFTLIKLEINQEIDEAILQINNNLPSNDPEKFKYFIVTLVKNQNVKFV